jgi:hypothetical protein
LRRYFEGVLKPQGVHKGTTSDLKTMNRYLPENRVGRSASV